MIFEEFERVAATEFEKVPEHFARKIENLALLLEEEPDDDLRKEEGLAEGETLLGVYRGIPLSARGSDYGALGTLPDTITLFRAPLYEEAYMLLEEGRAATFEEGLALAIRETLWHEIGHYFGLDEDTVHAREDAKTNEYKRPS